MLGAFEQTRNRQRPTGHAHHAQHSCMTTLASLLQFQNDTLQKYRARQVCAHFHLDVYICGLQRERPADALVRTHTHWWLTRLHQQPAAAPQASTSAEAGSMRRRPAGRALVTLTLGGATGQGRQACAMEQRRGERKGRATKTGCLLACRISKRWYNEKQGRVGAVKEHMDIGWPAGLGKSD